MKFRVEQLIEIGREVSVFARQLDEGNFVLSGAPRLGGVEIRRQVTQPRKLTSDGEPDLKLFAFQLVTASDRPRLVNGQTVDLT